MNLWKVFYQAAYSNNKTTYFKPLWQPRFLSLSSLVTQWSHYVNISTVQTGYQYCTSLGVFWWTSILKAGKHRKVAKTFKHYQLLVLYLHFSFPWSFHSSVNYIFWGLIRHVCKYIMVVYRVTLCGGFASAHLPPPSRVEWVGGHEAKPPQRCNPIYYTHYGHLF